MDISPKKGLIYLVAAALLGAAIATLVIRGPLGAPEVKRPEVPYPRSSAVEGEVVSIQSSLAQGQVRVKLTSGEEVQADLPRAGEIVVGQRVSLVRLEAKLSKSGMVLVRYVVKGRLSSRGVLP